MKTAWLKPQSSVVLLKGKQPQTKRHLKCVKCMINTKTIDSMRDMKGFQCNNVQKLTLRSKHLKC